MLTFKDDIGDNIFNAKKRNCERIVVVILWPAIRNEIFKKHYTFTGSLTDEQYAENMNSLLALDGTWWYKNPNSNRKQLQYI